MFEKVLILLDQPTAILTQHWKMDSMILIKYYINHERNEYRVLIIDSHLEIDQAAGVHQFKLACVDYEQLKVLWSQLMDAYPTNMYNNLPEHIDHNKLDFIDQKDQ